METTNEKDELAWSIDSRHTVQKQALRLVRLMEASQGARNRHKIRMRILVSVAFALWRAAFLVKRAGKEDATFASSRDFLRKVLTDNTVTFSYDVTESDWSFRFYADAARQNLKRLQKHWPKLVVSTSGKSKQQWEGLYDAFKDALHYIEKDLRPPMQRAIKRRR